jgi:hypothetical protein|eukprot:COSAG06_NODE_282_length_18378_cov_85.787461_6_plen_49_part_00
MSRPRYAVRVRAVSSSGKQCETLGILCVADTMKRCRCGVIERQLKPLL